MNDLLADDPANGLRKSLVGQLVCDEELDQALGLSPPLASAMVEEGLSSGPAKPNTQEDWDEPTAIADSANGEDMIAMLGMADGADIEFEPPRAEFHSRAVEFGCDEPGPEGNIQAEPADLNEHRHDYANYVPAEDVFAGLRSVEPGRFVTDQELDRALGIGGPTGEGSGVAPDVGAGSESLRFGVLEGNITVRDDCDSPLGDDVLKSFAGIPMGDSDGAGVACSEQERWLVENQEALQSSDAFVEQHGLPLGRPHNATTNAAIADAKVGKLSDVDIEDL